MLNCSLASQNVMNVASHSGNCSFFLSHESTANEESKAMLIERQKEYKMAALRAKKEGDLEQARLHFSTSKASKKKKTPNLQNLTPNQSDLFKVKSVALVQKFE